MTTALYWASVSDLDAEMTSFEPIDDYSNCGISLFNQGYLYIPRRINATALLDCKCPCFMKLDNGASVIYLLSLIVLLSRMFSDCKL